jgi:hypothetical protein
MHKIFQEIKNTVTTVSIYIYIYILLIFVINNRQHFKINSDIHNINSRNHLDLHCPQSHCQFTRRVHITLGLRCLTDCLFQYSNCPMTRNNLKWHQKVFLYLHSFYLLDEYFKCNRN